MALPVGTKHQEQRLDPEEAHKAALVNHSIPYRGPDKQCLHILRTSCALLTRLTITVLREHSELS